MLDLKGIEPTGGRLPVDFYSVYSRARVLGTARADEEKATANSIKMMAMQCGGVIGPWLGGTLMERVSLEFPAFVGSGLYAAMAALTFLMLRKAQPVAVVRPIPAVDAPDGVSSPRGSVNATR